MSFDLLCKQIIQLSDDVEKLLDAEDEENCPRLLAERQSLLEQLKKVVDEKAISDPASYTSEDAKLRTFLLSIQDRDQHYINFVKDKSKKLLGQSAQQSKSKKAIKAYRSSI